ncbi:ROK family protein [Streptomyces sp. NPDC052225]|uniref:ROK family protein n=1 Tax=Streptomyces sp. NPDC052225 TaxID=3154949 RepID=UPI00343C0EF3
MKAEPRASHPLGPPSARDRGSVRRTNLALALRLLRDQGPLSRSRIAASTGLPKPTVTSLVAELVDLGLAAEGPTQREGAVGRPGTLVHIDGRHICGIGVEISSHYIHVLALALDGATTFEHRTALTAADTAADTVLDLTARTLARCTAALEQAGARAVGTAVAVPGVIDTPTGTVRYAPALGWRNVHVTEGLRHRLGTTTPALTLDNDAKLGALAEYAHEHAQVADMVCITGQSGIGAGIISGGRLLRGAAGFAGEVGHMPLDPQQRPCVCGRTGCWETMVGLDALLHLAADPDDHLHDPGVELEHRLTVLHERAVAHDARTLEALERVADALGLGIALLADVLNPGRVVLGGYFTHIGDLILDRVRAAVDQRVMAPDGGGCEVALSPLGFTAAARGGAHLALDAVYQDPGAAL